VSMPRHGSLSIVVGTMDASTSAERIKVVGYMMVLSCGGRGGVKVL